MSSPWNEQILDRFAGHVSWEVRTCTAQLEILVTEHGNSIPPPPSGFAEPGTTWQESTKKDALLQASLMHLRSLDDFLRGGERRGGGGPPDIRAKDWFEEAQTTWDRRWWLDPRDRAFIDWWIVHLSSMRSMEAKPPPWRPADYGASLCAEMERFFKKIEEHVPARLPAFDSDVWNDVKRRRVLFESATRTKTSTATS